MTARIPRSHDLSPRILSLMAGVKGMKHRRHRATKSSDAATLTLIENRLKAHVLGQTEMSPTQVMAARAVYDKLRPSLSAIDQTVHDPRDSQDAGQLAARLAAMFNERPDLFEQVVALKNASATQQPSIEAHEQRVSH